MKRLSGVALVIYLAVPGVKHGVFVYNLIWIFFSEGLLSMEMHTHKHTLIGSWTFMYNALDVQSRLYSSKCPHSDIRLLCIFHKLQNTHSGGLLTITDSVSSDNLSLSPVQQSSFSQSRRDGGVFCALQT